MLSKEYDLMYVIDHFVSIFDDRRCELGEGIFWHPLRKQLFWFDILNKQLLSKKDGKEFVWQFDCYVSSAGWIDESRILISSEFGLIDFNLDTLGQTLILSIEENNPITRSNDGRVDPWGGFWISTMGKQAEPNAGSIYRYYQGELVTLFDEITIPNAICFSKTENLAFFTDTVKKVLWQLPLDPVTGSPCGSPIDFINFTVSNENPDGAIIDGDENIWVALWGSSKVDCYDLAGCKIDSVSFPAPHISCPIIMDGKLVVTSANEGLKESERKEFKHSGKTFVADISVNNQDHYPIQISK